MAASVAAGPTAAASAEGHGGAEGTAPELIICVECEDQAAEVLCKACDESFCRPCFDQQHRRGRRRQHPKEPLLGELVPESAGIAVPTPQDKPLDSEELVERRTRSTRSDKVAAELEETRRAMYYESYDYIPMRLNDQEREMLRVVEGALKTSEYTDEVDVRRYNREEIILEQLENVCEILLGLNAVVNYKTTVKLVRRSLQENERLFQDLFEVARRFKIMNPDLMRSTYGKLMYLLMDAASSRVASRLGMQLTKEILTVTNFARARGGEALLLDEQLLVAASDTTLILDAEAAATMVARKHAALQHLKDSYSTEQLTADDIERIVFSISDSNNYQASASGPVLRMLQHLDKYFDPSASSQDDFADLSIRYSMQNSKLSHSHSQQYTYVKQTLTLWKEITQKMFHLWWAADQDLLRPGAYYSLSNTGQGLNRVQSCPTVGNAMQKILRSVQSKCGQWVGLSVVHLGDRDVPNALIFIDKYTQVPRILGPIVHALDRIEELEKDANTAAYIGVFKTTEHLRQRILQDFFRFAFNGDGDDGGSCIDGRLTSAWNWCGKLEKKPFRNLFMLAGFQGFDGSFAA